MIYLDNAATTPVPAAVADAMYDVLTHHFGNPSSQYPAGQEMKKAVEDWRAVIAGALHCPPERLYFTSCGTEADNWALVATAEAYGNKGKLFLYTALADMLPNYIRYFDGVVYTPHSVNDVHSLLEANNFLLDYKDELMESKSLRLNLFPDIKKHIPDNTDLSLWKVKDMQWIKDCPVPADEEFKRVAELWEVE